MASVVDGNGGSGLVVVTELGHLKELARQLEVHLGGSSPDLCKHLASQISSITERSISLLITTTSSPHGASDAPSIKATKKRKRMDKNRHEVRVGSAGGGGDHPADDGYSWRKYGQKEILGAKHPRGYYRCTHKRSQGCAATKQVQRTDEDPTFFDVVYLGDHTCVRSQRAAATAGQPAADAQAPEYDDANLTAKTEEQLRGLEDAPTPFRFSSTPACLVPERSPFSAPSTSENWGVSPATSDSNQAVSFPPFEVAAAAQFEFEEVMSAIDRADGDILEDLDIYVSSFLA